MKGPRRVTLRSVLFHHIADHDTSFTDGLGVTMAIDGFRARIAHLAKHYHPVSLEAVKAAHEEKLPRRAVLVTFDDAYGSVAEVAADVLEEYRVPSVFFVNGGFVDHAELGTDNLVTHTANHAGQAALSRAVATVRPGSPSEPSDVLGQLIPTLTLTELEELRTAMEEELDHDPLQEATARNLYISADQLTSLPSSMAIGSHTRSHVRCRVLDEEGLSTQIHGNRSLLVEALDAAIESFSVPYGSALDLPESVADAVHDAGHDLIFLVEGRLNHGPLVDDRIMRVSLAHTSTLASTVELEVLPRMRYARDLIFGSAR